MKKTNFCAIFATMFVVATVITLASCSQDDEYYEDGLFTRADGMMMRSGGEPGGGGNQPRPILYYYLNQNDFVDYVFPSVEVVHQVSCDINIAAFLNPQATSNLKITDTTTYYNVEMKDLSFATGSKGGMLGVFINYYIRFYDRRDSIQAPDSTYREYFVPFDTITYMSNEIVEQPSL
ncbi:MAG: hypothetical protein Q4F47_09390 [Bacteroidaceae bacterium]|nr:hypothetical protein [Bacteroidaceae bacterium]